ncbi:MAG: hypothetical protein Q8M53_10815 [Burkholderiales bacterium]|nr:hypothetical protein [Burkholderiales bacterium]
MSFIVRFPTGLAVTYNDANFLRYSSSAYELYSKDPDKGGRWICSVSKSADCVIEAVPACRAEFPAMALVKAAQTLARNEYELRGLPFYTLRDLKRSLRRFNGKNGGWK